jgi:hypothetical protein
MNELEYRQHEGLGSTDVKNLLVSPTLFKYRRANPTIQTPAMSLGSAIHAEILEPEKKLVWPEPVNARTKAGKEMKADADAAGKISLTEDQHAILFSVQRWIREFRKQFSHWEREYPVTAMYGDVPIKGLLDAYDEFSESVVDIKTLSIQLDAKEVFRYAYNFGFHIQAGHYANVLERAEKPLTSFEFVCIQTVPPFGVVQISVPKEIIEIGKQKAVEAYTAFWNCQNDDNFGESEIKSFELELPAWAKD